MTLATHTAGVSVDGYTLTLAVNPWNIVRTYNLTPGRELLFACRYRLGTASNFVVYMSEADNVYDPLYGSFVGDQGAWSTAKMYFTAASRGGEAALRGALPGAGPAQPDGRNGGRLRPPDPGRNPGDRQRGGGGHGGLGAAAEARVPRRRGRRHHAGHPGRGATRTTLGNFLVRSNSQSSVALASFTVGGFQLEGYAMTLSAFAWNIVRTYTLTPQRRYFFGCRCRLGTASNLVMYVSAADNDYVGVTGTFLGTASQGVWSTARLDFSVPGVAKLHFGAFGGSIPGSRRAGLQRAQQQQRAGRRGRGLLSGLRLRGGHGVGLRLRAEAAEQWHLLPHPRRGAGL